MEGKAKELGIPFSLPVEDSFRIPNCIASVMELTSIEGESAIYQGVCPEQHRYNQKILIKDLQKDQVIEDEDFHINEEGKLEIGDGPGFAAQQLEEY